MTNHAFTSKQHGFTLIEVLVAFLVMAIGLMGIIGLQNTAMRSNFNSSAQMQAVMLAKEMADLVRANPGAMLTTSYNQIAGANTATCTSTGCTPQQMAAYDKYLWDLRLREALGAGATGIVCIDSDPRDGASATSNGCDGSGTAWAVKLWWNEGDTTTALTTADLIYMDRTVSRPSFFFSFQP